MLNYKEVKSFKLGKSGAGSFKHTSVFLERYESKKIIFHRNVIAMSQTLYDTQSREVIQSC